MTSPATTTDRDSLPGVVDRQPRVPDILDVIAALSSDAIPTPPQLARALLDLLPSEVWSNPHYRWLDPATKSGSILREVARRLMDGLTEFEPDPGKRATHILTNMLFGCAITHVHGEMTRRSLYVSRDASSSFSVVRFDSPDGNVPFVEVFHDYPVDAAGQVNGSCRMCRAPARLERGDARENYAYAFIHGAYPTKEMTDMQFDVIVGNPPYQVQTGTTSAQASPQYHYFVEQAIALNPKYLAMIIPSRWFTGGMGLDGFRDSMINDRRLRSIVDNPKLFDCFPGVEIKGGVNYFLWDRDWDGDCEFSTRIDGVITSTTTRDLREGDGVLVRDNNAMSIIHKVKKLSAESIAGNVYSVGAFGGTLTTNYSQAKPAPFKNSVPLIFGSHIGYITRKQIERNEELIDKWKVLLPKAGDGHGREVSYVLGEPIAVAPGSVCTFTYIIAGVFDTKTEAKNYANYLASKFVRFLVLQRKVTQDVRPDNFTFVPALNMKRAWTDQDLYEHFKLTKAEIEYIESTIHPREAIMSLDSPTPASHEPGGSKYRAPGERADTEAPEPGGGA